ncbi:hypothetical protein BDV98DRAFT_203839 [Pterulicium gracile]|uniref:Protection of telomeres protein 1 ssDNA-binding domain-containing protein n=1 Tax=Pterulicium gracile TaxID=1884261 RepID=A0A5C3QJC3_9AGAR|nr:hypothetical protein BDV98DRAFT_203839 [Pterula gracilis]
MPPTRTPSGALKIKGLGGRSHWLLQEVDQHTQPSGFIDITVEILGRYHMMVKDSLVTVLFVADYTPMKIPTPNLSGRFPRKLQPYVYRIECEKSALPSANSIKIGSICTITNNRIVLRDFYGTGLGGRQHDPIAKEHTLKWKAQPGELHTDRRVAKLIRRRTDLGPVMTPISDVEEGSVVSFTAQVMYVISDRDSTSLYVTDYTPNSHLLRDGGQDPPRL